MTPERTAALEQLVTGWAAELRKTRRPKSVERRIAASVVALRRLADPTTVFRMLDQARKQR